MALPVLAATLTTAVVFFPVTFLYGVSKFLFSALALAVVLSLFASYVVAMTVVPLFCARFIKARITARRGRTVTSASARDSIAAFNAGFESLPATSTTALVDRALAPPVPRPSPASPSLFVVSLLLFPLLGLAFFPRTDAGQFVINVKAPSGTRLERHRRRGRQGRGARPRGRRPEDLGIIVSNIGVDARLLLDLHHQLRARTPPSSR